MRTKKTVVILVSGKAGSGKDTVSEFLINKLQEYPSLTVFRYGFANPIKFMAATFMGWDGKKDEAGRKLLQKLGQIGREYDKDIWVKTALRQMDKQAGMFPFNFVVISDWRFPNEYEYLKKNPLIDVVTVRVAGRGGLSGETSRDVSEISLPEYDVDTQYYDYVIDNGRGMEELEKATDEVLSIISKRYIIE